MTTYKLIKTERGSYVERYNDDGSVTSIPLNEANADYQAYLNKDNPDYGKPLEL